MTNDTNLQTILEEYAVASGVHNDHQILREMSVKYPQFARELEDFAAARAVIEYAPDAEISASDQMRYRELGRANLQMLLGETTKLESLTDAAKSLGMNRAKFAAALGLSVSLVQYLEKRRLDFASIPQAVIKKISSVLEKSEEAIGAYLNQSPIGAEGASFKTQTRPEELQPKSFAEAVREDQTLSAEEKRQLIDL